MYNHACAFLAHLSKLESWNDAIHAPVRACVPAQPDTWSCGHRTILFIDIALRRSMLDAISAGDVDRLIVSPQSYHSQNAQWHASAPKNTAAASGRVAYSPVPQSRHDGLRSYTKFLKPNAEQVAY